MAQIIKINGGPKKKFLEKALASQSEVPFSTNCGLIKAIILSIRPKDGDVLEMTCDFESKNGQKKNAKVKYDLSSFKGTIKGLSC